MTHLHSSSHLKPALLCFRFTKTALVPSLRSTCEGTESLLSRAAYPRWPYVFLHLCDSSTAVTGWRLISLVQWPSGVSCPLSHPMPWPQLPSCLWAFSFCCFIGYNFLFNLKKDLFNAYVCFTYVYVICHIKKLKQNEKRKCLKAQ